MCPAGGVSDGQIANENTFDSGYLYKNADDTTIGVLGLNNTSNVDSGAAVVNTQRAINETFDAVGITGEGDSTRKQYSSNNVLVDGENHKQGLENLDEKFAASGGHNHNGTAGQGDKINTSNLLGYKLRGFFIAGANLNTVSGLSHDVSSNLVGEIPSTNDTTEGVVVVGPYNKVILQNSSGDEIVDGSGNEVFGLLTESSGAWTLSFYVNIAGVDTAYSIPSPMTVKWFYQKLFNPLTNAPVYDPLTYIPSENATADVIDASESTSGKVLLSNVAAQSVGSTNIKGTSARVSHEDHTHQGVHSVSKSGDPALYGDVTFTGSGGATVTQTGQNININASSTPLSSSTPSDVGSTGSAGSSSEASKADHVHKGVRSIAKNGDAALFGDVTIEQGANVTLTQTGNNIKIDSSGGGGGGVNLITNGDAETTPSAISLYTSGTIGTRPAGTQTAGAANLSTSISSSSPLAKLNSYLLTKSAVNAQGQNFSIPFTVDLAYRAKAFKISFDYIVNSGTFVAGNNLGTPTDSDLIWYIFDVTNGVYIEPSNFRMLSNSTTISSKFEAEFQTSANGTSYRLIGHVATTSALAWEIKADNFSVGPSQYVYGSLVSDWISYTPTTAGFGTITTSDFAYRRIGDSIQIRGRFAAGTVAATTASVSLPNGFVIDSTKIPSIRPSGTAWRGAASTTTMMLPLINGSASALNFSSAVVAAATNPYTAALVNAFLNNGDTFSFETGIIPISGASSSTQMSDSGDVRPVIFVGAVNSNFAISSTTPLTMSVLKDTHGAWSTNTFTVPISGDYKLVMITSLTAGSDTLQIYKNGASFKVGGYIDTSPRTYSVFLENLKAGDTIQVRSSSGITIVGNGNYSYSIEKVGGANQISATENIAASYYLSANQTTSVQINFDTKEFDTHSAVTTGVGAWKFTAPASGIFDLTVNTWLSTGSFRTFIYKNGVKYKLLNLVQSAANVVFSASTGIALNAGDYIDFRPNGSVTLAGGTLDSDNVSHVYIARRGSR